MNNQDLQLRLEEFNNGDTDAFLEIYEGLKVPVYTIIYRILYDHMMSEDVMQDIFLRLYKAPPSPDIQKPRAWIFQMARNLAIDCGRKLRGSEPLSDQTDVNDYSLENVVSTKMDVELAIKQLSVEDREIVTLHLNGGLKFREIARRVPEYHKMFIDFPFYVM